MRGVYRILGAATALAMAYIGWVFVSRAVGTTRWQSRHTPAPSKEAAEFDRIYGGSEAKILQFYERDANIVEGGKSVICYGVLNAKAVRLDPSGDAVSPALNRCVEVGAERQTRYTLTAEGADGRTVSESF